MSGRCTRTGHLNICAAGCTCPRDLSHDYESRLAEALAAKDKVTILGLELYKKGKERDATCDRLAAEVGLRKDELREMGFLRDRALARADGFKQQLDAARAENLRPVGALKYIAESTKFTPDTALKRSFRELQDMAREALAQSPDAVELLASVKGMEEALSRVWIEGVCAGGLKDSVRDALERFRKTWGK